MRRLACVILVDPDGRLLLQERDEHAPVDPDLWGLVGGGVENGEDTEAAAYRELEEETGVVLPSGTLVRWRDLEAHTGRHGFDGEAGIFVSATALTDADIDCREGRRIVFVAPHQLGALAFGAFAGDVVDALIASDQYRALRGGSGPGR